MTAVKARGPIRHIEPDPERMNGRGNKAIGLKQCRNVVLRDLAIREGGVGGDYKIICAWTSSLARIRMAKTLSRGSPATISDQIPPSRR